MMPVNGRSRSLKKQTKESDNDRAEWMSLAMAAWDDQFGEDEPEYTSDMIKVRLGHLLAIPKKFIEGQIGLIARNRHKRLLKTLSAYLSKK